MQGGAKARVNNVEHVKIQGPMLALCGGDNGAESLAEFVSIAG